MEGKSKDLLSKSINSELSDISDWLVANKLSINVKKSNFLFFSNQKEKEIPELKIQGTTIECKDAVKNLGVLIDDRLNWNSQIKSVSQKICQGIGILRSTKFLIPPSLLSNLYFSFIQSHLLYGILA